MAQLLNFDLSVLGWRSQHICKWKRPFAKKDSILSLPFVFNMFLTHGNNVRRKDKRLREVKIHYVCTMLSLHTNHLISIQNITKVKKNHILERLIHHPHSIFFFFLHKWDLRHKNNVRLYDWCIKNVRSNTIKGWYFVTFKIFSSFFLIWLVAWSGKFLVFGWVFTGVLSVVVGRILMFFLGIIWIYVRKVYNTIYLL